MRRNGGFTLLEVLIAIGVLAIGIVAVMQLFPAGLRQTHISAERTVATGLAGSRLASLRTSDINDSALRNWLIENGSRSLDSAQRVYSMYEGYQSTVQRVAGAGNTYRVTFEVKMADGRTETFVTYVTRQ